MPEPRARDLEQTRRELRDWLRGQHPEAHELEIAELRGPSGTGFSSDTLLFELRLREAGRWRSEPLVLRLEPRGFRIFPRYDLSVQVRVLRALAQTDVPVPRVRCFESGAQTLGSPGFVMERVEGRIPTDTPPYHVGGWVAELAPAEREALWWSGLEALARVHRCDWRGLGLGFLAEPERGASFLEQQLRYYEEFIAWGMQRARYPLLERALGFLHAERPVDEPDGLCWGDARISNQVFRELACVAILDWEMVRLGNPVQDLAWWIAIDRCLSEGIGVPRLAGLPDRAASVARWEEQSGRAADHLDYYEALGYFKFAVIMVRIGLQFKHYGLVPAENAMDRDNLASLLLARKLDELGASG